MTRADYLVVAFALALLPWLYLTYWTAGGPPADEAYIVDGTGHELVVPLQTEQRIEVAGPLGASVIEISGGAARFVSSPCPGKFCVHAGWLKAGGEFAACLPNRVSLTVASAAARYDSVNF